MRRTNAMRTALAAAVCTLACTEPTSTLDVVGTYTLVSVNALPLPFTLPQTGPTRVEVLDDMLFLSSSATYSEVGHKRYITDGFVTLAAPVDAGSFSRRGATVVLESLLIGRWDGSFQGNTLTMVQQGFTLVYRR